MARSSEEAPAIARVEPAEPETWDCVWGICSYSTYFHSREWAEIWSAYHDGCIRPAARHVTFTDGLTALLPLSRRRRGRTPLYEYASSPGGTFGGWLSEDELGARHRQLLARYLVTHCRDLVWRRNPYDAHESGAPLGAWSDDDTQALRLTDGFATVLRGSTKGHRSAFSKAAREGVSVSLASTRSEWQAFYDLYAQSVRRWEARATSSYDLRLLEIMWRRESPNIKLWLATHADKPVAGALCLYAPRHVAYWLGAVDQEALALRPVQRVVYGAIEDACATGQEWFDFNPSGGHVGVSAFKKGFGTIRLPAPVLVARGPTSRFIDATRRGWARSTAAGR
ncbi:MAG: GNAT family N-acetyltransferase [Solirubrobacteraceae bacterium]